MATEASASEDDLLGPEHAPHRLSRYSRCAVCGAVAMALLAGAELALTLRGPPGRGEPAATAAFRAELQRLIELPGANLSAAEFPETVRALAWANGTENAMLESMPRLISKASIRGGFSDLAASTTQCVIDVTQAAAYLMEAVVEIHASLVCGNLTTGANKLSCASNLLQVIDNVAWLASYLGLAATDCAAALGKKAYTGTVCESDVTTIVACVSEIAGDATSVGSTCKPQGRRLHGRSGEPHGEFVRRRPPLGGGRSAFREAYEERRRAGPAERQARVDRQFEQVNCAVGLDQATGYLVRAILQIRLALLACPDPRSCSSNILNVISSLGWVVSFLGLAIGNCPADAGEQKYMDALCAGQVADFIASTANLVGTAEVVGSDCASRQKS